MIVEKEDSKTWERIGGNLRSLVAEGPLSYSIDPHGGFSNLIPLNIALVDFFFFAPS